MKINKIVKFVVFAIAFGFLPGVGSASLVLPLVGLAVSVQDLAGLVVVLSMFGFLKPYVDAFLSEGGEKLMLDSKRHKTALAGINITKSIFGWAEEKLARLFGSLKGSDSDSKESGSAREFNLKR
jgi:hypothetical protein